MNCRRILAWLVAGSLLTGNPPAAAGGSPISSADLRTWLTYLASDELQGRPTFGAGLGLAAGYIQGHLSRWGVEPGGDNGGYLQAVKVLGVKATSRSTVTVRVGDVSRTFRDGEDVFFPREMGGRRTISLSLVTFIGYGLEAPGLNHDDLVGKDLEGAAVVYLGASGPRQVEGSRHRRLLAGRSRHVIDQRRAAAAIGPAPERVPRKATAVGPSGRRSPDFTTAERLDRAVPPAITAGDRFYEFLFSNAPTRYDGLKRKASAREPLPSFQLDDVTLTFSIDVDYEVVRTQVTHNVVGIVRGSDPVLRDTYVGFGAHYDHVGYAEGDPSRDEQAAPGRVTASAKADRIWNGADDDGSGTVALLALAKAFAASGGRPKRSVILVWHAGEERGLWGSRYFADAPTVPLDRMVALLNIDMIGRNRNDDPQQSNTVYLVGSDRISSELHDINRAANRALTQPLTLDYEMNDPGDLEQLYYRSDHYSYAAKGVPVIFFTTGLHPDYHANTDEVSRIEFDKLTRITQLVHETGLRLANLDHAPMRDYRGPRAGKGTRE
ncbi:MAG: M20/M25/M40 family metallo-hydrolase [Vicinamibacterales bacterium]